MKITDKFKTDDGKYVSSKIRYMSDSDREKIIYLTRFLPESASIRERLYCIDNDITCIKTCKCGSPVTFHRSVLRYSEYCSRTCEHKKKTGTKYGSDNAFSKSEVKEKIKQTNLKKYGSENPAQSETVKEKIKQTFIEKYGTEHPSQSESHKKRMRKNFFSKHKVNHFTQLHIEPEKFDLLNDPEWLNENIKNYSTKELSEMIGVSVSTIWVYLNKNNIDIPKRSTSLAEKEITQYIESLGLEVRCNVRDVISPFELDIVVPEKRVAIEYCGLYWHSTFKNADQNYHLKKLKLCNSRNYRLITIFEDEWEHKKEIVLSKITHVLGMSQSKKVYARKTKIEIPSKKTKKDFFNELHIQGDGRSSIDIGLMDGDDWVAIASFINHGTGTYELNRYATSTHIVGGFSKLLKHFMNNFHWKTIFTFADRRWSDIRNNVYSTNGFEFIHVTKPNYFYVDCQNILRHHRRNYTKNKLKKILNDNYDESKTELELTLSNNIHRIYDCGNIKYEVTKN